MTKSLPPKSLVLYADDDADDRELIADAFREFSSSIELVTFHEGEALLHFMKNLTPLQPSPCLIILDINMPRLDGKETLQKIRAMNEYANVPAVLFTTSTLPSEAEFARCYDAGFVTKPLHNRQIRSIIHELIDNCTDEVKEKIRRQRDH
ncbi:MAG: response regulator [Chitinophagaceae bacterium]|nr:MAG: response regulator [Chitinophagaceae bacterium]